MAPKIDYVQKEIPLSLPVILNDEEVLAKGDELVKHMSDLELHKKNEELRKKHVKDTGDLINRKIETAALCIQNKRETRVVICDEIFRDGMIVCVRRDSGEVIESRAASMDESQTWMPGLSEVPRDGVVARAERAQREQSETTGIVDEVNLVDDPVLQRESSIDVEITAVGFHQSNVGGFVVGGVQVGIEPNVKELTAAELETKTALELDNPKEFGTNLTAAELEAEFALDDAIGSAEIVADVLSDETKAKRRKAATKPKAKALAVSMPEISITVIDPTAAKLMEKIKTEKSRIEALPDAPKNKAKAKAK